MNVAFGAFSRHPDHAPEVRRRVDGALAYLHEVFPAAEPTHRRRDTPRGSIYNACCMSAWRVPTWYERGDDALSFSAPPIPLSGDAEPARYARTIWEVVDSADARARLQPNHFGCAIDAGGLSAWSDLIGLGRCYAIETRRVLAVSNHIGLLAFFADGGLTLDEVGWRRFAALGWFVEDRTGIEEIRRVPPATRLRVDGDGTVTWDNYADYDALVRRRSSPPDFDSAREQLATLTRNACSMLTERPVVQLSGGADSRLTAAAWLSPGNPALVRTNGTLEGEAVAARELMRRFSAGRVPSAQSVCHDVFEPAPGADGDEARPLEERLRNAMRIYDGDYVPSCVKADVLAAGGVRCITIGGGGGEIAHAQYYPTQAELDALREEQPGLARVAGNAPWTSCTEATQEALLEHLGREERWTRTMGRDDPSGLDAFYLRQRFRRWVVAGHQTTSLVPFAAPAFIRMAFDLTPEERVERVAHRRLTGMFVPRWAGVPYYKPAPEDLEQITDKGLRLWQQDNCSGHLFDVVASAGPWTAYFRRNSIEKMARLARSGEAHNAHEQWFLRVLWFEGFRSHLRELRRRTEALGGWR